MEDGDLKMRTSPCLMLMCALPGSGKTTLARRLSFEVPAVRLCPDEWMAQLGIDLFDEPFRERLELIFWRHAKELLRSGQSVILESGLWLRSDRDEKRLGARALEVAVELHYLNVSLDERWTRLQKRNSLTASDTVPLTRSQLEEYEQFFQAPDGDEMALFDRASAD